MKKLYLRAEGRRIPVVVHDITPAESLTAHAHGLPSTTPNGTSDGLARAKRGNDRSPPTRSLLCASSEHARALGSSAEPPLVRLRTRISCVGKYFITGVVIRRRPSFFRRPRRARSLSSSRFVRSTFRRRRDTRDPYYVSRPSPPASPRRRVTRLRSQSSAAKSSQGRPPGGAAAVRNFARRVCRPDDYARAFAVAAAVASFARVRQ